MVVPKLLTDWAHINFEIGAEIERDIVYRSRQGLCSTSTTALQFKVTSFDFKGNEKPVGCDERKLVKFKMLADLE